MDQDTHTDNPNVTPPGKDHPDLFKKTIQGGFWVFALRGFTQVLSMARLVILAYFLDPKDFGLLGIALLLLDILNSVTSTGIDAALIQRKGLIHEYLDTAWTINVIRGVVLYIIVYFAAPLAVRVKVDPAQSELALNVIRVTALSLVIGNFTNIATVFFKKDMRFHLDFVLNSAASIISIIISIVVAVVYKNVWALVVGRLANSAFSCVLSYVLRPYRPRFRLEMARVRSLWSFGRWITLNSILGFLLTHGDDMFVWAYLGVNDLGLYQMAYRLSNLPATEITHLINQVTFPAYAKIQDDIPRLREAYLKVLKMTAMISVPIAGIIFIFASDFVKLFMNVKWQPMIPALQTLVIYGLMRSLAASRASVYLAMNSPEIIVLIQFLKLIVLSLTLFPLTYHFGILGTSLSVVAASVVIQPVSYFIFTKKYFAGSLGVIRIVFCFMFVFTCTVLVSFGFKRYIPLNNNMIFLLTQTLLYIIIYVINLYIWSAIFRIRLSFKKWL